MSALLTSRWLYLNIAALGLVALLYWWWQQTTEQAAEASAKWVPDYYLTHATINQYDQQGDLSSSISAKRFTHIREFDSTDMLQPRFNIYLANSDTAWFGKADEGLILDSGAQINLMGNTLVTNGPDLNRPLSLKSQSLRLFPSQNYAVSDDQVSLISKYSHLTGKGMQLTLNDQRLVFLHQVQATHSTPRN